MAYQSPAVIHEARLTPAQSDSLVTANALLIEKWRLMYNEVDYRMIDLLPSVAVDAGETQISGVLPGTIIDTLTGETIPLDSVSQFVQPHGSSAASLAVDATVTRKFKDAIVLPTWLSKQPVDRKLTSRGESMQRMWRVTWPTALLDLYDVHTNIGDEFSFGGQSLEIKEVFVPEKGYWKFTNIPMYVTGYAAYRSKGS